MNPRATDRPTGRPRTRKLTGAVTAATLALALAGLAAPGSAQQGSAPPNVVLIVVDDMRWDEATVPTRLGETLPATYLPTIRRELIAKGFAATNAFVANSLCCPSRASILTGNYSHTTGVWNNQNSLGRGGFASFRPREGSTLATWFDAAGYRTGLVGKYFNGYNDASHVPAGWDRWVAFRASTIGYFAYRLSIDGALRAYGSAPADYSTDVLADHATSFIASTPAATPLFMMFAPYAPHDPYTPAPRHASLFSSFQPVVPPNLDEADVSDKPAWVRALPRPTGVYASSKRQQMRTLMAVDDAVADIIAALQSSGRLQNTVIVFMSDNGQQSGSHRWISKKTPWEESIRIPLIVRGPGIPAGVLGDEMMLNVDIADTLEALTGVSVPATEGVSLASLLRGGQAPVHDDFVLERLIDATDPPSYCGVRTNRYKYVRYSTGEEELYDLSVDPWELRSRHAAASFATIKAQLRARTQALCSPTPPGYRF
jgi:N-acetylglucosamine-6-sulfatase